jgi:hypothetical protein
MTTSGSRNFTVSRAEIIEEAVANIGALDPGNTLSAEETARASLRLNLMIKGWMARGANLWRREEVILYLQSGQQSYTFGVDHFAKIADVVETTTTVAAAAGATSVTVADATGIVTGDVIGIKLDAGGIHWPATGCTVAGSVLSFATALPSTAASGNRVYSYPYTGSAGGVNTTVNPVKIAFAYRRDPQDTDTPLRIISREEYTSLSRKGASGPVTSICHDKQASSKILVWPAVDTGNDKLIMVVDRVIEDFDTVANTPDFPVEWLNALMWGLSAELSNVYGLPISERQWLKLNASSEFESANSFDIEESTVRFEYAAS